MTFGRRELGRVGPIAALVAGITALHYWTDPAALSLHVVYREMYFVPILLAALRFGKWGGIVTAVVATALYLPHVALSIHTPESTVGNVLEIVFFCLFGAITGSYVDIRRGYQAALARPGPVATRPLGRRVLVCLDGSAASQQAAAYAGDLFGADARISITLFCLTPDTLADSRADSRPPAEAASLATDAVRDAIRNATAVLRDRGVGEARLGVLVADLGNERLSDAILREQRAGRHDVIVVARHRLTRAQEFLFGNVAVRLARQAPCPVLVVEAQRLERVSTPAGAEDDSTDDSRARDTPEAAATSSDRSVVTTRR